MTEMSRGQDGRRRPPRWVVAGGVDTWASSYEKVSSPRVAPAEKSASRRLPLLPPSVNSVIDPRSSRRGAVYTSSNSSPPFSHRRAPAKPVGFTAGCRRTLSARYPAARCRPECRR